MNKKIYFALLILLSVIFTGCSFTINDEIVTKTNIENKLEEGKLHFSSKTFNISAGESVYIKGVTVNDLYFYEQIYYAKTTGSSLDFTIELYENGADVSNLEQITIYNMNRNNDTNISFNIYSNVSNVDLSNSTLLPIGANFVGDKKFSDLELLVEMIVLKRDTDYYMKITNNNGGVLSINSKWLFFEE